MRFSIESKLKNILANPQGEAVLKEFLGEALDNPMIGQAMDMSLTMIASLAGDQLPQGLLEKVDAALKAIPEEKMLFTYGKHNISQDWLFTKSSVEIANPEMKDADLVQIPHTWNAFDGQDGGNDYHRGKCFYKKELTLDASMAGKKIYLEFEGANSVAEVYVNGKFMTIHRGGYSTFRTDVSKELNYTGTNIVLVAVDNSHVEEIYPLMADFTFGGGIYRPVNLIVNKPVHFNMMDHGSPGVFVSQKHITDEKAIIGVEAKVVNTNTEAVQVTMVAKILNGDQVIQEVKQTAIAHDRVMFTDELVIENPILWQGIENPHLYDVTFEIYVDDEKMDERKVATGLRYYAVDPKKGFLLNGKPWKLNGVSRHQDRRDMGWALTEKEMTEDMELIKEIGANSIRLAHYQHNQYFYDLCDQYGMVIWAEIPYISMSSKTDPTGENAKSQMVELIRQCYNHSSICFWGVQNEITIAGQLNRTAEIVEELHILTKKEDPYRVTTQAQVGHHPDEDKMNYITDTLAYNKYYGWYYGEAEDFDTWIEGFCEKNPNVPLGISEYGCEAILDYHTDVPQKSDYTEEYQAIYHEKVLQIFNKHDQIWGTYVWNMFDFACDMRDEGGVKGMNNKGLMTHDRKTRKDSFYWYQANWSKNPVLHITSKRYLERPTETTLVKVYSNLDQVTLFVNGQEIKTLTSDNKIFLFEEVALNPGENTIKVVSGDYSDESIIHRVAEANPSYVCPPQEGHDVANWFDGEDDGTEVGEFEYPEGYMSIKDTIGDIIANPEGEAVLRKYLNEMFDHPMFDMVKAMTLEMISSMQGGMSQVMIYKINCDLNNVKK